MPSVLCGVDLGGTKLGIGLVSQQGRVLDQKTFHDHVSRKPDEILDHIAARIRELLARNGFRESDLQGIGVGTAGHIRHRDGIVITMSNLAGFTGYPIRERLERRFDRRVVVDNDANAQAWGEYLYGAGAGHRNMVFMTISTQIGAGIVLDGKLFRGTTGTAGEIGHTIVDSSSELLCPCGNRGCLIALASGVAIPGAVKRKLLAGSVSSLVGSGSLGATAPGDVLPGAASPGETAFDGEFIARGLAIKDPLCTDIVEDFARYIGIGVYNIFQVFNPDAVVLGGGLVNWGSPFLEGIRSTVRLLARGMMDEELAILPGSCESPGIVGAASLVLGD
jgi:glucokinase